MTNAAPKVAGTRSDRFAPFLSSPLGSALCIVVSGVCYFVAIRLIDLWPFALLAPMPMLAAAFAAPSRTRAALCGFVPIFAGSFGQWSAESFFLSPPAFVAVGAVSALVVSGLVLVARAEPGVILPTAWTGFCRCCKLPRSPDYQESYSR